MLAAPRLTRPASCTLLELRLRIRLGSTRSTCNERPADVALEEVIRMDAKDDRTAMPWDVFVAAPEVWCERVSQGASFTLTLQGTPIALLLPPRARDSARLETRGRPSSGPGG